jgi:Asp-tRNA(Asn)/Glu-tRNA(Gln) amidotransferase A subunit family amidase
MHGSRRQFLKSAAATLVVAGAMPRALDGAAFDPFEKTIRELQDAMKRRQTTSVELVQFYLERIARYDPQVNAVLFVNPRALDDARALDAERVRGRTRGPLHGIPILLKDNFDTRDMPTTGGCLALSGIAPKEDAFQVKRLREAGAVLLGKANLHELALGLTTVSSLGGQTRNPYDLTRAPGGSSGGSAVAATMNFAAATLGTDTSGSIRIPSSHNNCVGLRPSLGLSSRAGIIPFGHTQDTGGPIARTVEDVAVLMDATVGYDPADPSTEASRGRIPRTYTAFLKRDALKGVRIGVVRELFGSPLPSEPRAASPDADDREVATLVQRGLDEMKQGGATLVDVTIPMLAAQLQASNLLTQELKFYLGDYLKRSGAPVASVEDLLASGLHHAQLQGILDVANGTPDEYLASDDYRGRLAARETLAGAVAGTMDGTRVDVLAYPVARRIAPVIPGNQIGSNAGLSAQSGFPAINVPVGFTAAGFPVGVELLGRRFAESKIIAIAYAFEQATRHRKAPSDPKSGPTLDLALDERTSFQVSATGAKSIPPSDVDFSASGRFLYSDSGRTLLYDVTISPASLDQIAGVYLHRRTNRPNGGVVTILAKSAKERMRGMIMLSEQDATNLRTGKLYLSVVSRKSPGLSARADLIP